MGNNRIFRAFYTKGVTWGSEISDLIFQGGLRVSLYDAWKPFAIASQRRSPELTLPRR